MLKAWTLLLVVPLWALAADRDPLARLVSHTPSSPHSGEAVRITANLPGNPTRVVLQYQAVEPGRYIELRDPGFRTKWVELPMQSSDPNAANVYTVELPATLQTNRRLIRYRVAARDGAGRDFTLPTKDAEVPNFAYFVYDGLPPWTGAINPRSYQPEIRTAAKFGANVMNRVQPYFLLAKASSVENIVWRERAGRNEYRYTGTLIANGTVYDHVRMRIRGGVWRYQMGKSMWKFDFPKTHRFQAYDDYGRPYSVTWNQINLRSCIQQGDYGYRGEQGMFEAVGFRLFNLAGAPAPATHWIQLRIITTPEESPTDQYRGDFWGLYLALEEVDGRFLRSHELPDGNVYKMEGGGGALSHHGAGAVTNSSDLYGFLRAYTQARRPEAWWRSHLNLPAYYSYRAICECIHHYDIGDGKNYYYYLNPVDHRWEVIPWDIDLTWANTMFGGGREPFQSLVLPQPAFQIEYQNRLRELRDLLFNPAETGRLIEECAAVVADPSGRPSFADADRAKWDYHPDMTRGHKGGQGLFYQISPTKNFRGMVELMKRYVRSRAAWVDAALLTDRQIPATPSLVYTGPPNFPTNQLAFRASQYSGENPFSEIRWRLGEVALPTLQQGRPTAPGKYEITPVWESGPLTNSTSTIEIPARATAAGHTYRARVRMKDATGRWSHWSSPVEFVSGGKTS